jgi:hypothetical protein
MCLGTSDVETTIRTLILSAISTLVLCSQLLGQEPEDKSVPILTGGVAFFNKVAAGQAQNIPSTAPVLLVPIGDNWLVEARGNISETYRENPTTRAYGGLTSYGVVYVQADYIVNQYLTVVSGRFLTPFGLYNERMLPLWIRYLQNAPISASLISGSSNGAEIRGGFRAGNAPINVTYSAYYSAAETNHILASARSSGGRIGIFVPASRLEVGGSFQKILGRGGAYIAGSHLEWQPNTMPLTIRSEYIWSQHQGSSYWIESVYRLSRVSYLRHLELVGRAQQYFSGTPSTSMATVAGLPSTNAQQGDVGLNYYWRDGLKTVASYGRQFSANRDYNTWCIGMSYRFAVPLMSTRTQ